MTGAQMVPPPEVRQRQAELLAPSQTVAMELLFALRACVQSVDTVVARWLGPDALSPGRFQVLVTLWSAGGPMSQRDIVRRLDVTRATISALIAALEKDGIVATTADAADKRKVLVALTSAGSALIERLVGETASNLREAFSELDDDELKTLTSGVERLTASVASGKAPR